uniref:Uncharacterized protein n=1 Tax=Neogobius melanostomus TaxID=47308 RepID=A0A8C6TP69_9GOBI
LSDAAEDIQTFKIILLGDSGVGKTTLLHRYIEDSFLPATGVTVGAELKIRNVEIEPGNHLKTNSFIYFVFVRKIITVYFCGTDGFLLVFDVTDHRSFENIKHQWFPLVPESSPCVLVGLKSDHKDRCVSREEAEELAKELGVSYVEASSVTGHNVKEAFETLVRREEQPRRNQELHGHVSSCSVCYWTSF